MPPRHLDRLTAVDAGFLHQEGPTSHMHIGALVRAEGPPPAYEPFLDSIRARLHYVPRYRQRLVYPPASTGRPLWADDPDFNLEFHVRHTALPAPGSDEQLMNLAARVFSQQLDRSKPLWELWLVEGLADGAFALLSKSHHAMIDGIAGVDLGTVLFDLGPEGRPPEEGLEAWKPDPEPSPVDLLAAGIAGFTKTTLGVAAKALGALSRPERAIEEAKVTAEGLGEIVWAAANPAPASPLNVEIGPHRRFTGIACDLADFKAVKNAFGGTVNDVVLAVVAGALRVWLQSRGVRTEGLELRALVPVSVRHRDGEQNGAIGKPARGDARSAARLRRGPGRAARRRARGDERPQGVKAGGRRGDADERAAVRAADDPRAGFAAELLDDPLQHARHERARTAVPALRQGREMTSVFPIAFLPKNHALAIAIMSYNGQMNFGLLGDYDAMPDLNAFGEAIEACLAELVSRAARESR